MPETFFEAIRSAGLAALRVQLPRTPSLAGAVLPAAEAPRGVEGFTALHLAVDGGEVEVVRLLVSAGAELEARNGEGRTALHDSIEHGHRQIQELLIDAGAEVDVCAAAILGMEARLRELLDRDPGLATETSTGLSPLGWASYGNQTGTAAELVARGARPDDGELLCAASVGHVEVGRLLI
ncbi:MAG: ankyrin repeat domain-containing protein, partial [Thermoanaerobaculia bacterium]